MVRRVFFGFALITVLLGFANFPAVAQSGRTFYVDFSGGSNANNGTSKSTPWKTHPYMVSGANCTGTGSGPAYSHQAGDQFIFKGGVTWPGACFPMEINVGGSSNTVRDNYAADVTWFAGGAFSKPKFAGGGVSVIHMIGVNASNVTLSTLDVGGQTLASNGSQCSGSTIFVNNGTVNVMATQVFLHDWLLTTPMDMAGHDLGGMCYPIGAGQNNNIVLDHSEVRDDGNIVNGSSLPVGVCAHFMTLQYTHCHFLVEGIVGHGAVHDNELDNITWNGLKLDNGGAHGNIIEANGYHSDGPVYNNLIHDNLEGVNIFESSTSNVYNNVMYNNNHNGQVLIDTTADGTPSTATANVYNNTFKCDTGDNNQAVRVFNRATSPLNTLNMKNNVFIGCTNDAAYVTTLNVSNNANLSLAQMLVQGLSVSTNLIPTAISSLLVSQGAAMASLCGGNDSSGHSFSALCSDTQGAPWHGGSYVPRSTSWDVGAYQFSSQSNSTSKPSAPNNLAAIVQ